MFVSSKDHQGQKCGANIRSRFEQYQFEIEHDAIEIYKDEINK
jgi:hypothetical protein